MAIGDSQSDGNDHANKSVTNGIETSHSGNSSTANANVGENPARDGTATLSDILCFKHNSSSSAG
jgi:hypothetical protein